MKTPRPRGRLFVISGPSGVGKGTVVRRILVSRPRLAFSVSSTTRSPRPGEVEGRHYHFVSEEEFDDLVAASAFVEWAEVFGERYGTPERDVREHLEAGRDVVLEIDVQGARSVRSRLPEAVLVFLQPPSEDELNRRLTGRGTESGADLQARLEEARREMSESSWFDHVVVNDDIDRAVSEVLAIIDGASQGDS